MTTHDQERDEATQAMDQYDAERTPAAARAALPWAAAFLASAAGDGGRNGGREAARASDTTLADMLRLARVGASNEDVKVIERIATRSVDWAASRGIRTDALIAAARQPQARSAATLPRTLMHAIGF